MSIKNGTTNLTKYLLQNGACPFLQDTNANRYTPIETARRYKRTREIELLEPLIWEQNWNRRKTFLLAYVQSSNTVKNKVENKK
jgi:hypothetical protein